MKKLLYCLLFYACGFSAAGTIKPAAIFGDRMVLQQQTTAAIWGWAEPGENITISNGWSTDKISGKADAAGKWKLWLPTPKAGGPYTITIAGDNTIELHDVLIGEVWVCSGQSNMGFALKSDAYAKEEIPKANHPAIRYFSVKRQYGNQLFDDCPGSKWELTTPVTAPSFSAVAYYFAKHLDSALHVPIGIVYAAWGGTPAEAWTPAPVLQHDKVLTQYFDRWTSIQQKAGPDSVKYLAKLTEWEKDSIGKKKPQEPQSWYYFKRPWREPAVLYNGMIHPVIPYAVKGILWYQGESNVTYANEYALLLGSMISSWREAWQKAGYAKQLPFYLVQLSSYGFSDMDAAARLREAQEKVSAETPQAGMVITTDLGNMKDIHYTHKKEVGQRLAMLALAQNYEAKKLVYKGPVLEKLRLQNNTIIAQFDAPLVVKGAEAGGFEIGYQLPGNDSIVFTTAKASVNGREVTVWNEKVTEPVAIRFAWLHPDTANLFNQQGLPAFPFRRSLTR